MVEINRDETHQRRQIAIQWMHFSRHFITHTHVDISRMFDKDGTEGVT